MPSDVVAELVKDAAVRGDIVSSIVLGDGSVALGACESSAEIGPFNPGIAKAPSSAGHFQFSASAPYHS